MQRSFESGNHNIFLIGDSGYPLELWLMTPLPNQPQGSPKFRYNEALCKARNPVERRFGVVKEPGDAFLNRELFCTMLDSMVE
ncbi:putative nuclease HARBI1 [Ceratitis capitata]|uniref:putative nuclease HARBI1 n=1 Tax=Ceratitis capitata TaxID=7213 RepID=UPI000A118D81|nr:putative nuclease HARBI1 [Ceratitis capitata]